VTTDEILLGLGLILVLAVGAHVLAVRVGVPAIIVLLLVGFVAGAAIPVVGPHRCSGPPSSR
jgi:NhaP-type Na+/H+ or K+/H+ antiporter